MALRFYIETYGCQMNVADSELMGGVLNREGHVRVEDPALQERLDGNLAAVFLVPREAVAEWTGRLPDVPVLDGEDVAAPDGLPDRALGRVDAWLDRRLGYHPLAIRLNYRHGFHAERMQPGHPNWMLDTDRDGPLPHWASVERAMERWFFSARRHVPVRLLVASDELDPSTIQYAAASLTNAQVLALADTPIELVAAPGSGKYLEFVSAVLFFDYGGTQYTETADNLEIHYQNEAGVAATGVIEMTGFIDQAGDMVLHVLPIAAVVRTKAAVEN